MELRRGDDTPARPRSRARWSEVQVALGRPPLVTMRPRVESQRLNTATKGTAHMRSRDVSAGQAARPDHCVARRKFLFAVEQVAAHQPGPYRRPSDAGLVSAREPRSGGPRAASPSAR
jgi:hypothetical protein